MTHRITLIAGDGIGPEVSEAVLRILKVAGVSIEWEPCEAGVVAFERTGPRCRSSSSIRCARTRSR